MTDINKTQIELTPHEINVVRRALVMHVAVMDSVSESSLTFDFAQDEISDLNKLLEAIK